METIQKLEKPISPKCAEQNIESLKDELPPWQFKLVAAFIESLREKMTRIGLAFFWIKVQYIIIL